MDRRHVTEAELRTTWFSEGSGPAEENTLRRSVLAHCQECSTCNDLLRHYLAVEREITSLRQVSGDLSHNPCPGDERWLRLVAEVLDDKEAMELLTHASECSGCAQKLAAAQVALQTVPEDVAHYAGFTPQWYETIAQQLAASYPAPRSTNQRKESNARGFWFSWVPLTAGIAATIFCAIWFVTRFRAPNVEHLLAQAYSQDRTLELRVPGAPHTELRQRRAGSQESLLSSNAPFRNSEEVIRSLCASNPQNTQCLLYEARLNLLVWRYSAAQAELHNIGGGQKSSDFLLSSAIGYFEEAEAEKGTKPVDHLYAEAIEDLSTILTTNPQDRVALFNRALLYEKLQMMESASADWHRMLDLENDAGWRDEAAQHLTAIEQKKKPVI